MSELYQARPFLTALAQRLADGGIESPRRDANLLVQMALGLEATILSHHELSFDARASDALEALIARRLEGCPISRLRGYREFYSLLFHLNEDTLDPRPDSECLVDAAIEAIGNKSAHIADFGTGSGCLLLSVLAHCPHATGVGLDLSEGAIRQARDNAAYHDLTSRAHFQISDWDSALEKGQMFDVILSNPPYIPVSHRDSLSREVKDFDPPMALFAGESGLRDYEILIPKIVSRLVDGGACFIEIGKGQETDVIAIAEQAGLNYQNAKRDLSSIIRCLHFVQQK